MIKLSKLKIIIAALVILVLTSLNLVLFLQYKQIGPFENKADNINSEYTSSKTSDITLPQSSPEQIYLQELDLIFDDFWTDIADPRYEKDLYSTLISTLEFRLDFTKAYYDNIKFWADSNQTKLIKYFNKIDELKVPDNKEIQQLHKEILGWFVITGNSFNGLKNPAKPSTLVPDTLNNTYYLNNLAPFNYKFDIRSTDPSILITNWINLYEQAKLKYSVNSEIKELDFIYKKIYKLDIAKQEMVELEENKKKITDFNNFEKQFGTKDSGDPVIEQAKYEVLVNYLKFGIGIENTSLAEVFGFNYDELEKNYYNLLDFVAIKYPELQSSKSREIMVSFLKYLSSQNSSLSLLTQAEPEAVLSLLYSPENELSAKTKLFYNIITHSLNGGKTYFKSKLFLENDTFNTPGLRVFNYFNLDFVTKISSLSYEKNIRYASYNPVRISEFGNYEVKTYSDTKSKISKVDFDIQYTQLVNQIADFNFVLIPTIQTALQIQSLNTKLSQATVESETARIEAAIKKLEDTRITALDLSQKKAIIIENMKKIKESLENILGKGYYLELNKAIEELNSVL
jgi:hypothetical protein